MIFGSCTHRVLDFTLISSKNVDFTKSPNFVKGKSRIKGEDMVHWIVIVPIGSANVKEAIDKAIESTPGCVALLDGVVYTKFWWIPYIYGKEFAIVEGTPLIDPSLSLNESEGPSYGKIELNKNGEIEKVSALSSDDYVAIKEKKMKDSDKIKFNNSKEID